MNEEERNNPGVIRVCIDAHCPKCGHPERFMVLETGEFGCRRCSYTSMTRNK